MAPWRAVARFSCAAPHLVRGQSQLAGSLHPAIFVQASSLTSSTTPNVAVYQTESVQFQPVRVSCCSSQLKAAQEPVCIMHQLLHRILFQLATAGLCCRLCCQLHCRQSVNLSIATSVSSNQPCIRRDHQRSRKLK